MPRDITGAILERACEQEGCPLCRLARAQERRWLWMLLWENVNDPGVRDRIAVSWGFCRRHAWELAYLERRD